MPLRDILKKKEKVEADMGPALKSPLSPPPEFTFMRSDTHTQEVISLPDDPPNEYDDQFSGDGSSDGRRHRFSRLKGRSRSGSTTSNASRSSETSKSKDGHRRLSERLGLRKDETSTNVPENLPEITDGQEGDGDAWEQRATILARENEKNRSRPGTPVRDNVPDLSALKLSKSHESGVVSSQNTDDNIQEAIRLHEAGQLEEATEMFGRLADPNGENNALSQVLYGLALRHGWGCNADPEKAMVYLSAAASNAALIENVALQSGRKGGGAAKGELVLAIFELANSFRHGWGVKKDPVAAKQYYETAANLGDTDAMNEVAWCYLEGFGCKKDKLKAAKYYRLAEEGGNKILGNSWIWKPKYDPPK